MAWMHHQKIGIKEVERKLAPAAYVPQKVTEAPELRFLRNYSNYLTPRTGLLSADFWAFLAGVYCEYSPEPLHIPAKSFHP